MSHEKLKPLVYGIKGVGSQGDGTGQLLCKDATCQKQVVDILQSELGMPSITCTLSSGPEVKRALIPAAGFGPQNFPAALPIRSELFPIVDHRGVAKPIILHNVEALIEAGIDDVFIIVQKEDLHSFERLFKNPMTAANHAKLTVEQKEYAQRIIEIGEKVHFIIQESPEGFGHAVHCAKDQIGDEHFLLVLGDHVYSTRASDDKSCSRQMLDAFKLHQRSVIGLKQSPIESVSRFGTVGGVFQRDSANDDGTGTDLSRHQTVDITVIAEKPSVAYARDHLMIPGLGSENALTMFGQYIISPRVFDYLDENIRSGVRHNGSYQFTPALQRLMKEEGLLGLVVDGQRFDIGTPDAYFNTLQAFGTSDRPMSPLYGRK